MTALVVDRARQLGRSFEERLAQAVALLDGEEIMGRHLMVAYAAARISGENTREAIMRAHWGMDVREPRAGWNIPVLERHADQWVARLDAAVERVRAKAARR